MPGKLREPWKPGESGNPGGRPKTKLISEAYRKLLVLSPEKLKAYKPTTGAEELALAMFRRSKGKRAHVIAAKEVTDRVEGRPPLAEEDREALTTSDEKRALMAELLELLK